MRVMCIKDSWTLMYFQQPENPKTPTYGNIYNVCNRINYNGECYELSEFPPDPLPNYWDAKGFIPIQNEDVEQGKVVEKEECYA